MRKLKETDFRSREIIEILSDVVKATSENLDIVYTYGDNEYPIKNPTMNYVFGSAQYIKERLDELSLTPSGNEMKFPLIALFCPFSELRGMPVFHGKASVTILIACSTLQQYSNEQRREYSFANILRPIYRNLLAAIAEDGRFDIQYEGGIPHRYSENYSYGRYGAHTPNGDAVGEPIDAILLTNVELTVKNQSCKI